MEPNRPQPILQHPVARLPITDLRALAMTVLYTKDDLSNGSLQNERRSCPTCSSQRQLVSVCLEL